MKGKSYFDPNPDSIKKMSFDMFKKSHKDKNIDYFEGFSDDDWQNEYEKITGKKVIKKGE
jgi:hypothetical protein